jgi:hypothetical protein
MRMRMAHPRGVLLAAMAALFLTGCTAADNQRWNEFWGLDKKGSAREVKGKKPTARRNAPKTPPRTRTAKSDKSAMPKDTAQADKGDPAAIDAYAARMGENRDAGYEPNDHTSKMRRQQDSKQRRRVPKTSDQPVESQDDSVVRTASGGESYERSASPVTEAPKTAPDATTPARQPAEPRDETPELAVTQPKVDADESPAAPVSQDLAVGVTANRGAVSLFDKAEEQKAVDAAAEDAPVLTEVTVTAGAEPAVEADAPKTAVSANKPAVAAEPVDTFLSRVADLRRRVADDPNNLEDQLRLRMLYLADGQDDKALASIAGTDAEIEEIIHAQVNALIAARSSSGRDPATWANRQLDSTESLRKMLGAKADLSVPKVALCTEITGFGLYKPIEPAEFQARRKNLLLVYIEVENFVSKKTPSGLYRTLLSVRQSLVSQDGQELWSKKDENIEDLARRQRRDFYLTIGPIAIPKSLAPGSYILKVEVEDALAGKMNSAVAKFKLLP